MSILTLCISISKTLKCNIVVHTTQHKRAKSVMLWILVSAAAVAASAPTAIYKYMGIPIYGQDILFP